MVVAHLQAAIVGRTAHHIERAAFPFANGAEHLEITLENGQHIAFLRFIGPDLHRRHARLFHRHGAQVEDRTASGVVDEFREGIGQTTGADIVDRDNRVVLATLPAAVNDLLATAFDFRVATLHRVEVEVFAIGTGVHAGCGTAAQTDQEARTAQLDQQGTFRDHVLVNLATLNIAHAAGNHDRLVVTAHLALEHLFEGTEVTGQVGTAKFVVEGGAANRTLQHDIEGRGDARRTAVFRAFRSEHFPGLAEAGDIEVGDGETGQAGFRARTTTGSTFVADLTTGAGRRPRERRNGRRVIVGFHLHQDMGRFLMVAIHLARTVRVEAAGFAAFDHRRVVAVGDQRSFRMGFMGVADHAEQRFVFLFAVDDEFSIKNLVTAMLRVRLGKHHQFDIARVAAKTDKAGDEVIDLVVRQGKAQLVIGIGQRDAPAGEHIDRQQRLRRHMGEQSLGVVDAGQNGFRHAVMQQAGQQALFCGRQITGRLDVESGAAFDTTQRGKTAVGGNVGGLGGPRRQGTQPRSHQEHLPFLHLGGGIAIGQQG